jgi:type II secretory pathway pseudopilin PulG
MAWSRYIKVPGQLLIELLLAVALLALITPPLIAGLIDSNQSDVRNQERQYATAQLQEMTEAARAVRARGWQYVATPGTYHPVIQGTDWSLASGSGTLNGVTTSLVINNVSRDAAGAIVTTGGTNDPSTKRVTISVSYGVYGANTLTKELLLTRYLDNELLTDTTQAQFAQGTPTGSTVTNTAGGEVILSVGGRGNWCLPNQNIVAQYDLPQDGKAAVVRAIQGKVFTGTDYGYDGKFVELGINQADPPQFNLEGIMNGYDTNDIFIDRPVCLRSNG